MKFKKLKQREGGEEKEMAGYRDVPAASLGNLSGRETEKCSLKEMIIKLLKADYQNTLPGRS